MADKVVRMTIEDFCRNCRNNIKAIAANEELLVLTEHTVVGEREIAILRAPKTGDIPPPWPKGDAGSQQSPVGGTGDDEL